METRPEKDRAWVVSMEIIDASERHFLKTLVFLAGFGGRGHGKDLCCRVSFPLGKYVLHVFILWNITLTM